MAPSEADTPHPPRPQGKRIILTTIGSMGDLHPFIAIALGLKSRGHQAVVATGECYREKVEALGLGFHPLRPDSTFVADPVAMRRIMDFRLGSIHVLRETILPALRQTYEDTLAAADGADLLVSHPLTFATRLVSEARGIPWASTTITPLVFGSAYDPPALPGIPDLSPHLRFLGPWFWVPLRRILTRATRVWARPLDRLRAEIGLPPAADNPLVDGHSPALVLTLFSRRLADKQPDWPPQTIHTGFPFYDGDGAAGLPPELARFLDDGPPPVVFTLSISAATVAGPFFKHSVTAAERLGRRAVLIVGKAGRDELGSLPEGVAAFEYAPFSELFPRAAAVVHAGGIGTTGLAMRSGRPMLVVPHAHDQPDNGHRLARLGIARVLWPRRYTPARVAAELGRLFDDPAVSRRAEQVAEEVRREDGVKAACDALETLLEKAHRVGSGSTDSQGCDAARSHFRLIARK
jgi:UDP:flavonoid glycosyltransferase YjiC (YdhE family)